LNNILQATIAVFRAITQRVQLDPSKIQSVPSLHTVIRVFRGIQQVKPKENAPLSFFLKIWKHEIQRVFGDALTPKDQ
jgi:hypothetical protein